MVCAIWYKILKLRNSALLECHICEQLLENFFSVGSLALRHFRSMTEGKCKKRKRRKLPPRNNNGESLFRSAHGGGIEPRVLTTTTTVPSFRRSHLPRKKNTFLSLSAAGNVRLGCSMYVAFLRLSSLLRSMRLTRRRRRGCPGCDEPPGQRGAPRTP